MTTPTLVTMTIPPYSQFTVDEDSVTNNHGHLGECEARCIVEAKDGTEVEFVLTATLQADNPDSSDDDLRAEHSHFVSLTANGVQIATCAMGDYEYHGDTPGEHMCDMLEEGDDVYESLREAVEEGKASLAPGYTFD